MKNPFEIEFPARRHRQLPDLRDHASAGWEVLTLIAPIIAAFVAWWVLT